MSNEIHYFFKLIKQIRLFSKAEKTNLRKDFFLPSAGICFLAFPGVCFAPVAGEHRGCDLATGAYIEDLSFRMAKRPFTAPSWLMKR